jgi:hypothetical protein
MERVKILDFQGVRKDVHRAKLPDGFFQEDKGGSHFDQGSWKVRRGQRHTSIAVAGGPVEAIAGFSINGGSFALIFAENTGGATGLVGELNYSQQADS